MQRAARTDDDAKELRSLNMATRSVWGLGDEEFPYARETLASDMACARADGTNLIQTLSSSWRLDSSAPVSAYNMLDPFPSDVEPWEPLCSSLYGLGKCQYDFTIAQRDMMQGYGEIMNSIVGPGIETMIIFVIPARK